MAIRLETSRGNRIVNFQDHDIPQMKLLWCQKLARLHPNAVQRTDPSPVFNCHGLTFASRRSQILDRPNIQRILDDDLWREILNEDVKPGDIILYFDEAGDPSHSGIVLQINAPLGVPTILSKWGCAGEYIHLATDVPAIYGSLRRFYRSYI